MVAIATIPAVPTNTDPLTFLPLRDPGTDGIYDSDHFVSGNARVLDPRKQSFFDYRIAMTNATRLNLDSDPPSLRLRNVTLNDLQRSFRVGDLYCTHFVLHIFSIAPFPQKYKASENLRSDAVAAVYDRRIYRSNRLQLRA
jgi:hypothetical protein